MSGYVFPIAGGVVTSQMGFRNVSGGSRNHQGVDIGIAGNKVGTPILAPIGGQVIYAGTAGGYGNQIKVMGDDGIIHSFSHLNSIGVQSGSYVSAGQVLGGMGNTGRSTGPHLHYETIADGKKVNPLSILANKGVDVVKGKAKEILKNAAEIGLSTIPGGKEAAAVIEKLGVDIPLIGGGGDECGMNPFCYLRKWMEDKKFWPRMALFSVGILMLIGAVLYLSKGKAIEVVTNGVMKNVGS